jgi:hypothetical protein
MQEGGYPCRRDKQDAERYPRPRTWVALPIISMLTTIHWVGTQGEDDAIHMESEGEVDMIEAVRTRVCYLLHAWHLPTVVSSCNLRYTKGTGWQIYWWDFRSWMSFNWPIHNFRSLLTTKSTISHLNLSWNWLPLSPTSSMNAMKSLPQSWQWIQLQARRVSIKFNCSWQQVDNHLIDPELPSSSPLSSQRLFWQIPSKHQQKSGAPL